ncbi:MAG: glycosyltransferase [Calditrichaeota bacterium]|nr:MAG: glycosyltransferase [Calditrichota bacterium]
MARLRIGMILERDFPPDDRPEKEALSLIEAGHEVHMLAFTWQNRPLYENYKGIRLTRFPISRQVYKKLSAAYLVQPFYRRLWKHHMERFIRDNHIDVIHIHDLPMTDVAHELAARYGCKVVCDQHEYWSNWIVNTGHYNSPLGKVVSRLSDWKSYERTNLHKADLVITVTNPLRDLYINEVGLPPEKVLVTPNTPSRSIFNDSHVDPAVTEQYRDKFVLFYAGAMDVLRGLDMVINALPQIEKKVPHIRFVLAGRFSKGFDPPAMARERGVAHLVEYVGWLNVEQLPSYIAAARAGIFTPPATRDEINNTIATKIYQYLAMGKPIFTSEARMMRDFVVENGLGWAVPYGNIRTFAEQVIALAENYEEEAERIRRNARSLIEREAIFWDQTVQPMLAAYEQLSGEKA